MAKKDFIAIVGGARKLGFSRLTLTSEGEPLLHPRIEEFIRIASDLGFRITINTNGTLLTEEKMRVLSESNVGKINLNIPSGDADCYAWITNSLHVSLSEMGRRLRLYTRLKKKINPSQIVSFEAIITRKNYEHISKTISFADYIGVDQLFLKNNYENHRDLRLSDADSKRLYTMLGKHASFSIPNNIRSFMESLEDDAKRPVGGLLKGSSFLKKCFVPHYYLRVRLKGDAYGCCKKKAYLGNVKRKTLASVWYSSRARIKCALFRRVGILCAFCPNSHARINQRIQDIRAQH